LQRIDTFIQTYQGQGYVVATDWDGTLYSETIHIREGDIHSGTPRGGQSIWHLWGAQRGYFPAFNTEDGDWVENAVERDDYLEGKTNAALGEYGKFSQIAAFEAGMTPQEMHEGVQAYLEDYPTEDYAYLKMLDVLQQFKDHGFQLWIVTGSNPYFVVTLVNDLDRTLGYDLLAQGCDPGDPDLERCQIVGNGAKQSPDGRFTMVYDDRFVTLDDANTSYLLERHIIDGAGKAAAIRNYIETQARGPVVFYAGNSGGDYEAVEYVLDQDDVDTLVVAVNPRGTLQDLVAVYGPGGKIVEVQATPAKP
jgi:phosphoglycolate phosphatase-like HAD superfamily hydrolase